MARGMQAPVAIGQASVKFSPTQPLSLPFFLGKREMALIWCSTPPCVRGRISLLVSSRDGSKLPHIMLTYAIPMTRNHDRPSPRDAVSDMPEAALPPPTRRLFDLSDRTKKAIAHAHVKNDAFCSITKVVGIEWTRFGKAAMKGWRMSPDGCIQMAYQLAYYRL